MKITQVELRSGSTVGVCWVEADRAEVGRVINLGKNARLWVVTEVYKASTTEMIKGTLGFAE